MNRANPQHMARFQHAVQTLYDDLQGIPGKEMILDAMVSDWVLNVDVNNAMQMNMDDLKEIIEYLFQDNNLPIPDIAPNQYSHMLDAFRKFVREYYAIQGGRRKKTRKSKKRSKKTRKSTK
jgi:hypothetical protein